MKAYHFALPRKQDEIAINCQHLKYAAYHHNDILYGHHFMTVGLPGSCVQMRFFCVQLWAGMFVVWVSKLVLGRDDIPRYAEGHTAADGGDQRLR